MAKIEQLLTERSQESIIEIGQIMQKFYEGRAGAIFRAMVNGRIKEMVSQLDDVTTNADRRLGRAEGIQMLQDDIELAISHMEQLTTPIPEEENNE